MSDVATYRVFVCALFTGAGRCADSVLPDDDMRCAIETCRSSERVLV